MALAIQKGGGKDCIETISKALKCIGCGKIEDASKLLGTVKSHGSKLEALVQETLQQLEPLELEHIAKVEELMREIGQLGRNEEELQTKVNTTKSYAETKIALLKEEQRRNEQKVRDARDDLQRAEQRKNEAENCLDKAKRESETGKGIGGGIGGGLGAMVGGLLGFFVGGPVGVVAGAAIGGTGGAVSGVALGEIEKNVIAARGYLNQTQQHKSRCESAVSDTQNELERCIRERDHEVSTLSDKMTSLNGEISQLQQERQKHHEEAGRIRELIVFMKEAKHFWGEFGIAVNGGTGRTDLLQNLVDKAKNPELSGRIIKSKAAKKTVASFMDAWEEVEDKVREGRVMYWCLPPHVPASLC